jgi:hypothetical protein
MDERLNFEPIEQIDESLGVVRELLREPVAEIREPILESVLEFDNEPKSARTLAEHFGITDRAIQNWFKIVADAYCWLPETDLKMGDGKNTRYLPFTISAMQALRIARQSGQTGSDWITAIHNANADKLQVGQPTGHQPHQHQLIEGEILDDLPAPMIHVPDVQGLSRLDLARKRQSDVQDRLTQTLEEFKQWDKALNTEISANKQATEVEGQADFDEKVIDLLLKKKAEQDRLKKLEALIDSGAISADELLKRYAATSTPKSPGGNESSVAS